MAFHEGEIAQNRFLHSGRQVILGVVGNSGFHVRGEAAVVEIAVVTANRRFGHQEPMPEMVFAAGPNLGGIEAKAAKAAEALFDTPGTVTGDLGVHLRSVLILTARGPFREGRRGVL